jgi:hypothetical protein
VVNNIHAPTYKLAKFFQKWLSETLQLPNRYIIYNSIQLAHNVQNFKLQDCHRSATFDIKDLYVNLPIQEILQITKSRLLDKKLDKPLIQQALQLLDTIIMQNYCQFEDFFYQSRKGVAMGSPISSIVAEIFLQHYKEKTAAHHLENKRILYCNRYVDDILIIYDSNKFTMDQIHTKLDSLHHCLIFKPIVEENNAINYLDLAITRQENSLGINIFHKPTTTDTTIHYTSSHPMEHKLAAFRYMINRLNNLPLTPETLHEEESIIRHIALSNGYPVKLIQKLQQNTAIKDDHIMQNNQPAQKWVTFKYYSPLIRKITNIFKNTNI